MTPHLDDRGDEPPVRHSDGNGHIDVLIVCDSLAISRASCTSHKHHNGFVSKVLDCCHNAHCTSCCKGGKVNASLCSVV